MEKRLSWNAHFLAQAKFVGTRSTCFRAQVGAVIVNDKRVISSGYNGAPRGRKNCLEMGSCYRDVHNIEHGTEFDHCYAFGAHSENNAVINAALFGISTRNSDMYIYGHDIVCDACQATILNAGISKVYFWTRKNEVYFFEPEKDWKYSRLEKEQKNGIRRIDIEGELTNE
jgi:dCMP deaminase